MEQDIAAYYNQTQNHYKRWWKLERAMALHYGLWFEETSSFVEALHNTNVFMADLAQIKSGDRVLDAGCGVGGSAIYLASEMNAKVTGISLSELQIETAKQNASKTASDYNTSFLLRDYCKTGFDAQSFDVIWACESSSSTPDKTKMLAEWTRLLKPGGKLIILDFFRTEAPYKDTGLLEEWSKLWAMSPLVTAQDLEAEIYSAGLNISIVEDLSRQVVPTVKRMYWSYLFGKIPSLAYNTMFGARVYSKNHYKSGYYQYKAFNANQWKYMAFLAIKP